MLKLLTNENNPAALKLIIASKISKIELEIEKINTNNNLNVQTSRILPCLKVDEIILFHNSALLYLLKSKETIIEEFLEWDSTIFSPCLAVFFGSNVKHDKNLENIVFKNLEKLNKYVKDKPFIDNNFNAVNVALWSTIYPLFKEKSLFDKYLVQYTNIVQWFNKLDNESSFIEALKVYNPGTGQIAYQALLNGAKYPIPVQKNKDTSSSYFGQIQQDYEEVTENELSEAETAFSIVNVVKLKEQPSIILPVPEEKNILITSALPYVNNVPHLGNIIGCVLSADVFARFCRICNYNTLYIGGTDEYGTATETKALEEGLSCQDICNKYFKIHNDIYKWFNISFDYFGRTSTPEQTELCQNIFLDLNNNGFIFIQSVEQLHCENCDRYLADRFVEGGCPHPGCNYEDARGDQCDGCGKLVNANELKNPRCKLCQKLPKLKSSEQFFLDLPKLEPLLHHWMKKSSPGWSNNAEVIGRTWLKEGLKPRCITRDLKWGVPVPLKNFDKKVFYVWFDAPIGYMSISKGYTEKWEKWWKPDNGTNVVLHQFMAKDNVPFHAVMFPATLLGTNKGYITVSHITATEYLNYEDGKFSKSRGIGVFGNDARDTGISSDVWRFYLLYMRPESQDSSFSWMDLAMKNNTELLNNLGNFINRSLMFIKNNFNKIIPLMKPTKEDYLLLALCNKEIQNYCNSLEKGKLKDGIRCILAISKHGNQYMQSQQPWVLIKGTPENKERAGTVTGICCNIVCSLSLLLFPYMPETSSIIQKQLNISNLAIDLNNPKINNFLPSGHKLCEPSPLFTKLELEKIEKLKIKYAGQQCENSPVSENIKILETKISEQADKVRILKSSGVNRTIWQPEVEILLLLKKDLEQSKKSEKVVLPVQYSKVQKEDLEKQIETQGDLVRKLKQSGVEKSIWQPEVNKLLDLKGKLQNLTGIPLLNNPKKGKK